MDPVQKLVAEGRESFRAALDLLQRRGSERDGIYETMATVVTCADSALYLLDKHGSGLAAKSNHRHE